MWRPPSSQLRPDRQPAPLRFLPYRSTVRPPAPAWQPDFDADDDLNGLLEVSSPLLARAFRGTDRRRS